MNATAQSRVRETSALWSSVGIGLLMVVLAAGVVVWQVRWTQSIRWEESRVMPLQMRGDGDAKPMFSEAQLQAMSTQLQAVVDKSYRTLYREQQKFSFRPRVRPDFVMGAVVQELPGARVMVMVRAIEVRGESKPHEWTAVFGGASQFQADHSGFGQKVASEMLTMARL